MTMAAAPPIAEPSLWLEPLDFVSWRRRLDLEHRARHLTRARRDALRALLACAEPDGTVSPTDAEVAEIAAVSARTVRRARADARELGLLDWTQTRQLVAGRWRQGRNFYRVRVPATLVCPGGQAGRASKEEKKASRHKSRPSSYSDGEARQNAQRLIALLLAGERAAADRGCAAEVLR